MQPNSEPEVNGVSHTRLFEAAEAVVTLVTEAAERQGGWVSMRGLERDGSLDGLTPAEVDEGFWFLIRMGFIELRQ